MIGQTAEVATYFDEKSSDVIDTSGNLSSQGHLYQNIADNFAVGQRHNTLPESDTISDKTILKDIFPDKIPQLKKSPYSFSVLQEWEGYVLSISQDTFTARLVDVTRDRKIEDEEADFAIDDLDDVDRSRICPGSIFRWIIGYRRSPGGTKDRASRIVLRNLPSWTSKELEKNKQTADAWSSKLNRE